MSMDFEQARLNMIEQQIRPWEVLDQRVLDAMAATPREDFVPGRYRMLAFADIAIALGHGEVMMPPKLEGRLLQALSLAPTDSVLEIGTGSGYLTALLARLARRVVSVDIYADFVGEARDKLAAHGVNNVELAVGDARLGWPAAGRCDAIAVTGSLPEVPHELLSQLQPGGRLFVVVGAPPAMQARLVTRLSETKWASETLFETELPPLVGAEPKVRFAL